MSGYQDINIGTIAGDHTGEDPHTGLQKMKDMFKELFGSATNSYLAATLTVASTDNYDPWGAAPPQDFWLELTVSTVDSTLTGLRAGFDGQRGSIRNGVASTNNLVLANETTSTAANRFSGQGDGGYPPGAVAQVVYRSLPNPRWSIG